MRKSSLIVILAVIASAFGATLSTIPENVKASTLYVGGGGPGNYTTIQSAIDNANPGDTIFVYNGNYLERITIDKPLDLVGQDNNNTVVDGQGLGDIVTVASDWVNFTGFKVTGNGGASKSAILLSDVHHCHVANNNVSSNSWFSISLLDSENNTIVYNLLMDNWDGLRLIYSHNNTISGNIFIRNTWGAISLTESDYNEVTLNLLSDNRDGLSVDRAEWNTIVDNTFTLNGRFGIAISEAMNDTITSNVFISDGLTIHGYNVYHYNTHTITEDNIVNGRPILYYKDCTDLAIDGVPLGQLIIANCTNVEVRNLYITDTQDGISTGFVEDMELIGNTISHTLGRAITSRYTSQGVIAANHLSFNLEGVSLVYSDDNEIMFNSVSNNTWMGIDVAYGENNRMHHNNISDNAGQAEDNTGLNQWDDGYPSGGNYWSNYLGNDVKSGVNQDQPGSDGIGDLPVNISGGSSQDRYPLMESLAIPEPPSAPQNPEATGGDEHINLTWDPPADDGGLPVTNYRIYRGDLPGNEAFLIELGDVLAFTDNGLTNGHTYYYLISAVNLLGGGEKSEEISATPGTTPSSPENVTANATNSQVFLSWSPPVYDGGFPITNYSIHRSILPDEEILLTTVGDVLNYTDVGLTNGMTYFYRVTAVNALGESPLSDETSGTPENDRPNCTITVPSPGETVSGTIQITGEAADPDGLVQLVEVRVDSSTWLEASGKESWSLSWDTTNLSNGEHTLFARSFDGENYSTEVSLQFTVDNPVSDEGEPSVIWIVVGIVIIVIVVVAVAVALFIRKRRGGSLDDEAVESEE